ncbi:MAG: SIR2 family protein [Verrucomicrobiaceae bacterium]|nr:SIR2 family protein [Verrucomicrobiaceae bacterium]
MSESNSQTIDDILKLGQECLGRVPVTVLGSGASLAHGVGGMGDLQTHLLKTVAPEANEATIWDSFKSALADTSDLEKALHQVQLPEPLERRVVAATREMVIEGDRELLAQLVQGKVHLPHARLFRHLLSSTHTRLSVVTTNYDRLAEYAAVAGAINHSTGFAGAYVRSFESGRLTSPVPQGTRQVDILKVHGSLDWFMDDSENSFSLPDDLNAPATHKPLMVTPGTGKYLATHMEPFRSIIACSDSAFASARSIFCVGYGFRDMHIQPKLTKRVTNERVPVVVLARTLTPEARAFLKLCKHSTVLGLEQSGDGSTAYTSAVPDGIKLDRPIWRFDEFLRSTIGD